MKTCSKCKKEQPESEFYAHKKMTDGLLSHCKTCVKKRVLAHRKKNLERIRAYDRERGQWPSRKADNRRRYLRNMATPEGRAAEQERKREWAEKNRVARAAHILVGNAIRDGRLHKGPCERCGKKRAQAHHEDYYKPMEVTWLCTKCHGDRHRELNEQARAK